MRNVFFFKTAACAEYEQLLKQCQQALIVLHERREQVRQDRLSGLEVGRELLTLQARYAKAYAGLLKHSKNCDRCQFGSKRKSVGTGANRERAETAPPSPPASTNCSKNREDHA